MKEKGGAVVAVGTMSGTSLDGVDAAVLVSDGVGIEGFGPSRYRPYSGPERAVLRSALGKWPGEAGVAEADWTGHCTYSDPERFFSYRRATHEGLADYGRLISVIRL